jgi:O-antigen/teichoic acid export membrane protein
MTTSYTNAGNLIAQETEHPLQTAVTSGGLSRWMFWMIGGSLAVLDQGIIAASNFVIGILLARWLLPEQYGSYALAFAIFLLLSFSYQALLLEPQRVFGPSDYADWQPEYLGVLLRIHSVLALAIFLALGISAWLMHVFAPPDSLPGALAGVTVAAPCVLLLWLARGAFYVRMSPQHAITGAAVYCAVVLVGLLLVYRIRLLSPLSAFLLMALAALISSAVLLVRLKPVLKLRVSGPSWKVVFQQHWKYGRWILVSLVLSWLSGDIYYPLVCSFSGMAAGGALRALLNFYLPVAQTFSALSIFVLPYASRVYQENGPAALTGLTRRMAWLFAAAAIAYWAVLILFSKPVMHSLYGGRYMEVAPLVPWLAAASLPWNVAIVPTIALRAVRSSASILCTYCASSAVAVLIGVPATRAFGLRGALWAMTLSNSATLLVAFTLVSRKLRNASMAEG